MFVCARRLRPHTLDAGDHKRKIWTLEICFVQNQVFVSIFSYDRHNTSEKNYGFSTYVENNLEYW